MPYSSIQELPDSVKGVLPTHAQDIFKEAFNGAYGEYKNKKDRHGNESQEEAAFKVAWSAVKSTYEKGDDGKWRPRKS